MNANSAVPLAVGPDGDQVVAHVGLHALGSFADRIGLGHSLSAAFPLTGERAPLHDLGKVLTQAMLMLAGGGEACADIEHLRAQPDLFGAVPSDSTLYRTFRLVDGDVLDGLRSAVGGVRAATWRRCQATTGSAPVVLDVDSSLHEVHSEHKEGAAPHYKGGYGFHPIYCFADATGECLAEKLRPGSAGANDIADHLEVLDSALAQLPAEVVAGHRPGDDPSLVRRAVEVRVDSAGCTGFVHECRRRNISFSVVARTNQKVRRAVGELVAEEGAWAPALRQDGGERPGAAVAEATGHVDLSSFPAGTRLIVRREPLHPGAQQSLFPSLSYRYWGFYTDRAGSPVELDAYMRAHAHVENHIARLKESGAERFPFSGLDANRAWLAVVCLADALVRWFQLLCLAGPLAAALPKRLRWALWHAPGRLVRHARRSVVRLLEGWPAADALLDAYRRLRLLS